MSKQFDRSTALSSLPTVAIGDVPAVLAARALPLNSFGLFDERDVALYRQAFEQLQTVALVGLDALAALRRLNRT